MRDGRPGNDDGFVVVALRWAPCLAVHAIRGWWCMRAVMREAVAVAVAASTCALPPLTSLTLLHLKEKRRTRRITHSLGVCGARAGAWEKRREGYGGGGS
jgi:hypothetical protein